MKLNGLEITGFIPDLATNNSQIIELASSFLTIGGPNGSGKTELLRRLKACFTGDASQLNGKIDPGILLRVSRDYDLGENKDAIWEDLFIQNFHEGLSNNLSWDFLRSNISKSPKTVEEFERSLGMLVGLSSLLNFDDQLTEVLKKLSSHSDLLKNKEAISTEDYELLQKISNVLEFVTETVVKDDQFLGRYSDKFMESYEILLVPVGNSTLPMWNAYLVNRYISENVDETSFSFYLHSLPIDYFKVNPEKAADFAIKRDTGAVIASKYNGQPMLAVNVGRVEAVGFALVDPDNSSLEDMRKALNASAASVINWREISVGQTEGQTPERQRSSAIKRMVALMNSMSDPKTPIRRTEEAFDFLQVGAENKIEVTPKVHEWLEEQSRVANELAKLFLPNLPKIIVGLNNPFEWPTEGIFNISVRQSEEDLPLETLSLTQQRWVKFALSFSLFTYNARRIVLLDEPELGLQRNLEANISEVLEYFSETNFIVTSSHSSIFLRAPQVIGVKVDEQGARKYTSYFGSLYSHLQEFDISEAEYFESFKLIVVTEGERDKAMLEGFAGNRLDSKEILLVSGTGIKSWEGFFTSYIFPMLASAKIVFLVDGFDPIRMNKSIEEAKKISYKGHPAVNFYFRDAIATWSDGAPLGKKLTETFAESLTRAVLSKDADRIFFDATGDRDCIEWLPISTFPLKESSWDEVWKAARPIKTGDATTGEDFKNYIKNEIKRHNPRLNIKPESLREMASMASIQGNVPKRISKLIDRLVKLSEN